MDLLRKRAVAAAACCAMCAAPVWGAPWPAEPLGDAVNLTAVEGPGSNDFHSDLSGAFWNPLTRRLWVCRNGPGGSNSKFWALAEDGAGGFVVDERDGARGEWTGFGDLEGITQADYAEDVVYVIIEGEERIKEFDVSAYGVAVHNRTWDTRPFLPLSGGSGAEGITFVPDGYLADAGFVDQDGNPYTSQHGMGGLMFVAHQNGGRIYAFDLDRTDGSFTFVGAYRTNFGESCSLEFDRSTGLLFIFHGGGRNTIEVTDLTSVVDGGERKFVELYTYAAVAGGNLEGIAVQETDDCVGGERGLFLTIDDGGSNALFWFQQFPCPAECMVDDDCDDGVFCNGAEICTEGACASGAAPCAEGYCDESADECVDCLVDGDCDDGVFCNGDETCSVGSCLSGAAPCMDGFCDESADECVECLDDDDCDDGVFCNGAERCTQGSCAAGEFPCDGDLCDEALDDCVACIIDADCDDGDPCTLDACGAGACFNLLDGADDDGDGVINCTDVCTNGPDVDTDGDGLLDCLDGCPADPAKVTPGVCGCGVAEGACGGGAGGAGGGSAGGQWTQRCSSDAACDDGLFCNGQELCVAGECVAGETPCLEDLCDERADACRECAFDADCDDGDDCTLDACVQGQCRFESEDRDGDRDGVPDCLDQCPGMDDVDRDGDGVLDCDDNCPLDPEKLTPGRCGCGVSESQCAGGGLDDVDMLDPAGLDQAEFDTRNETASGQDAIDQAGNDSAAAVPSNVCGAGAGLAMVFTFAGLAGLERRRR